MTPDADLLARFVRDRDAAAFAGLVERYLPLVNASARRHVADAALADDVCQAVFIILSNKAASLHARQPLADWLRTVTRYAAANAVKQRARRQRHEAAAAKPEAVMPDLTSPARRGEAAADWTRRLDHVLDRLPDADRYAVLLRYYGDAEFADVAAALNVSEAAARKRVTRAVGRLRGLLAKHGVPVPTAALAAALPAVLTLAPPPALAAAIPAAALSSSTAALSATVLAKGTMKAMLMTKIKLITATAIALLAVAGTGTRLGYIALARASAVQPALKPVVGWLKITYRFQPAAPPRVTYVEPSAGRVVVMSETNPQQVEAFVDPPAGVDGRLFADVGRFVVGPHEIDAESSISNIYGSAKQYTETGVLEAMGFKGWLNGSSDQARAAVRAADTDGERVIDILVDIERIAAKRDATTMDLSTMPDAYEMHTDVATGVIRRLTAMPTKDGKTPANDVVRTEPVAGPPVDLNRPETFALPAGVARVDNRPSAEVRKLMSGIDDILDRGPGFETAVLVSRSASPTSGEFSADSDEVTVYAGTAKRFVLATWALTPKSFRYRGEPQSVARPANWPKPRLADVLAVVGDTRPNDFVVCDGTTCWGTAGRPFTAPPTAGDTSGRALIMRPDSVWLNNSPVGRLWGTLRQLSPTVSTQLTLTRDPESSTKVVLESRSSGVFQVAGVTKPSMVPIKTVRLTLLEDLGPYPVKIDIEDTSPFAVRSRNGHRVIDISQESGGMFREPVRVPMQWRTMFVGEGDPSYVRYDTLTVDTHTRVPTAWFDDPAKTWPKR